MPDAAPLMIATFPASRMSFSSRLHRCQHAATARRGLAISAGTGTMRGTSTWRRLMAHRGLKFGIFLAPFHRLGENPTLAIARDVELLQWLDWLGYDEAWIGEHHSAGWELIAAPELIIAAAAEKTKHIKLGSGVTSLPYHHPLMVAQRFVQLDHMTRGRAMLGLRPGRVDVGCVYAGDRAVHAAPAHAGSDGRDHASAEMRRAGQHEDRLVRNARCAPASASLQRPAFRYRGGQHDHAVRHDRRGHARRWRAVDRRRTAGRAGSAGQAVDRSPRTPPRRTARRWIAASGAWW